MCVSENLLISPAPRSQSTCTFSIVRDYQKFFKYNIRSIVNPPESGKPVDEVRREEYQLSLNDVQIYRDWRTGQLEEHALELTLIVCPGSASGSEG